jgi:hypothetical protein
MAGSNDVLINTIHHWPDDPSNGFKSKRRSMSCSYAISNPKNTSLESRPHLTSSGSSPTIPTLAGCEQKNTETQPHSSPSKLSTHDSLASSPSTDSSESRKHFDWAARKPGNRLLGKFQDRAHIMIEARWPCTLPKASPPICKNQLAEPRILEDSQERRRSRSTQRSSEAESTQSKKSLDGQSNLTKRGKPKVPLVKPKRSKSIMGISWFRKSSGSLSANTDKTQNKVRVQVMVVCQNFFKLTYI